MQKLAHPPSNAFSLVVVVAAALLVLMLAARLRAQKASAVSHPLLAAPSELTETDDVAANEESARDRDLLEADDIDGTIVEDDDGDRGSSIVDDDDDDDELMHELLDEEHDSFTDAVEPQQRLLMTMALGDADDPRQLCADPVATSTAPRLRRPHRYYDDSAPPTPSRPPPADTNYRTPQAPRRVRRSLSTPTLRSRHPLLMSSPAPPTSPPTPPPTSASPTPSLFLRRQRSDHPSSLLDDDSLLLRQSSTHHHHHHHFHHHHHHFPPRASGHSPGLAASPPPMRFASAPRPTLTARSSTPALRRAATSANAAVASSPAGTVAPAKPQQPPSSIPDLSNPHTPTITPAPPRSSLRALFDAARPFLSALPFLSSPSTTTASPAHSSSSTPSTPITTTSLTSQPLRSAPSTPSFALRRHRLLLDQANRAISAAVDREAMLPAASIAPSGAAPVDFPAARTPPPQAPHGAGEPTPASGTRGPVAQVLDLYRAGIRDLRAAAGIVLPEGEERELVAADAERIAQALAFARDRVRELAGKERLRAVANSRPSASPTPRPPVMARSPSAPYPPRSTPGPASFSSSTSTSSASSSSSSPWPARPRRRPPLARPPWVDVASSLSSAFDPPQAESPTSTSAGLQAPSRRYTRQSGSATAQRDLLAGLDPALAQRILDDVLDSARDVSWDDV
ncbi:hypothetical protein HK405_007510, partial [Cladochytrium tenue]